MFQVLVLLLAVASTWSTPLEPKAVKQVPFRNLGPRIINGEQAQLGELPWQAGLYIQGDDTAWFCGGTILNEQWILTAGHCVSGGKSGKAYTGVVQLSLANSPSVAISQLILHEDYDASTLSNDVGLIQLAEPLDFNENVQSIRLSRDPLTGGEIVTVSGWGLTSDNSSTISPVLNRVDVEIITNQECENSYGPLDQGIVCASATSTGNEIHSPCSGDSGGPVILREGGPGTKNAPLGPVHVGVVSFVSDQGCESGDPSGYSRTSRFIDWIEENINDDGPPPQ